MKARSEWAQGLLIAHRFGLRMLRRRATLMLLLGLFVGSSISATLGFFSANVQHALNQDVAEFLGAPLVIRSSRPLPQQWWPQTSGTHSAQTAAFTTGAIGPGGYQSIALKAVSDSYPLQGQLLLRYKHKEPEVVKGAPERESAWLDQRAMNSLGVALGDRIQIGSAFFSVAAELVLEPDRLTQLQHIAPRVVIAHVDLDSVGLDLQSGRGEFRYLFDSSETHLANLETALPQLLSADYEVLKPDQGSHPFSRMSLRAGRFLGLVSVLVLLLCGSASAVLADHIVSRYSVPSAVLRCLGTGRRAVAWAIMSLLGVLSLLSGTLGAVAGWFVQPMLFNLLSPHLQLKEVVFSIGPAVISVSIAVLVMVGFIWPRLNALGRVPVMAAMRGNTEHRGSYWISFLLAGLSVGCLLWMYTDNIRLIGILAIGVVSVVAFAVLLGWGLSKAAGQFFHFFSGWLRVVTRAVSRSASRHMMSMATLSLAAMAFLVTAAFRGGFLDTYHDQRLTHDGNYLFSGLAIDQIRPFKETLAELGVEEKGMYPVVRATLISINGVPIDQALSAESDTREEARSQVRLSWAERLPANNELHDGAWPQVGVNEVSVESEVMSDLGLKLGDELGFSADGTPFSSRIGSTRGFKGGGSSMMFWFMFAPGTLDRFRQTYMGGIQIDRDHRNTLASIVTKFPSLRITVLEHQISRVRSIMAAITRTFDSLMLMIMSAALVVLFATTLAHGDTLSHQSALLHAIGVTRRRLRWMRLVERAGLGLFAGAIGILGAHLVMSLIFHYQFALPYRFGWWLYLSVPALSAISLVVVAGLFDGLRSRQSVTRVLQQV